MPSLSTEGQRSARLFGALPDGQTAVCGSDPALPVGQTALCGSGERAGARASSGLCVAVGFQVGPAWADPASPLRRPGPLGPRRAVWMSGREPARPTAVPGHTDLFAEQGWPPSISCAGPRIRPVRRAGLPRCSPSMVGPSPPRALRSVWGPGAVPCRAGRVGAVAATVRARAVYAWGRLARAGFGLAWIGVIHACKAGAGEEVPSGREPVGTPPLAAPGGREPVGVSGVEAPPVPTCWPSRVGCLGCDPVPTC